MKTLLALLALPGLVLAQSLEGTWQGTLVLPNKQELRTVIQVTRDGAAMKGTLISIDQNGARVPISAVTLQGSAVKMTIPGLGGSYDGKLEADGTITGSVTQGPNSMPLPLKRATKETAWELPPPPAPPKALPADAKLEFEVEIGRAHV